MSRSTKDKNDEARTKIEQNSLTLNDNERVVNDKLFNDHPRKSNKSTEKRDSKSELPKSNQPIYLSIRRSAKVREEVDNSASVEAIVEKIKGSKILKDKKNRKELLEIIKNFLKFKR
jgi:hypothetical protein